MPTPTKPPVLQAIEAASALVEERGIDLDSVSQAYRSIYPQVNPGTVRFTLLLEVASIMKIRTPYSVESVAQQFADESGAFPWDGPVGNGLTLAEYQSRFRDMAQVKVFLGQQLGLLPES